MKRIPFSVPLFVLFISVSLVASACVDLFHSTDFETLCGVDAGACGAKDAGRAEARVEAGPPPPINFCKWSPVEARSRAEHACAWLGACSVPFDHNGFGQCMIDAILAYDCEANPNQTVTPGPLHDLWQTLATARSCAEVTAAVNPMAVRCDTTGFGCGTSSDPHVAVECLDGGGGAETCLVEGRVCTGAGACVPPKAAAQCHVSKCESNVLHDCEGNADLGYDCTPFGAGTCMVSPVGPTCEPTFARGTTSSCTPSFDVTCTGNKATACATGQSVSIDCTLLTGASTCKPGTPAPEWNVAVQCQGPGCSAGCQGTDMLLGCAQGASFSTSCSKSGLGACRKVPLPAGATGYACTAPAAK